jgi:hypothetical protein
MKTDHELLEGLEQAMGFLADEAKEEKDDERRSGYIRASAKIRQLYDNLCEEMKVGTYSNDEARGVRYGVGVRTSEDSHGMLGGPYTQLHMAKMDVGRDGAYILKLESGKPNEELYQWDSEDSEWIPTEKHSAVSRKTEYGPVAKAAAKRNPVSKKKVTIEKWMR